MTTVSAEEVRTLLQVSPILMKFNELLKKYSDLESDDDRLPAEFRGFPTDYLNFTQVIFKRSGRKFWYLDYVTPRVAIYRVVSRKVIDPETGEVMKDENGDPIYEEVPVHERTVLPFVPVEIKAFHDFTIELAARELNSSPPILYQWIIVENALGHPRLVEIEPSLPVELLDKLKEKGGYFTNEALAKEAIDSILVLARILGAVEHVDRPMAPGIYWNPKTQRLEAYDFDTTMPEPEEVREALELLDAITRTVDKPSWRKSWAVKFGQAFKWAVVAALGYAYKVYNEKRLWIPYLLTIGESQTGKTHCIGRMISEIWQSPATSSGATWSLYNLSELISSRASVVVVNEAANLFRALAKGEEEDNLFNLLKNAPEQYLFRVKNYKGSKKLYPSLATFAFNANMSAPKNEAIRRRFLTIEFTKVDKIPPDAQVKFEREILPKMGKLSAIGRYIFNIIQGEPELLGMYWVDLAEELVKRLFAYAGMLMPEWVREAKLEENYIDELEAEKVELVSTWIREHLENLYFRYNKIADSSTPVKERVRYALESQLSPYFELRGKEVIIKKSLLPALQKDIRQLDIYNFKALCELMDWEYKQKKINKRTTWVGVSLLEDFLALVAPESSEDNLRFVVESVVDALALQDLTFDELWKLVNVSEESLQKAILELIHDGVVFARDGKYRLNKAKARELGFVVSDAQEIVPGGGGE